MNILILIYSDFAKSRRFNCKRGRSFRCRITMEPDDVAAKC